MTLEEFLDKLGDHGQEGFMYHPNEREVALRKIIQSAILAEREACAKIALDYGRFKETQASEKGNWLHDDGIHEWSGQEVAGQICARSNAPETEKEIIVQMPPKSRQAVIVSPAPETPNKAPETPENLQASTFPASILKTCT